MVKAMNAMLKTTHSVLYKLGIATEEFLRMRKVGAAINHLKDGW